MLNLNQSIDSKDYALVNSEISQVSVFSWSNGVYSCQLNSENFLAGHALLV